MGIELNRRRSISLNITLHAGISPDGTIENLLTYWMYLRNWVATHRTYETTPTPPPTQHPPEPPRPVLPREILDLPPIVPSSDPTEFRNGMIDMGYDFAQMGAEHGNSTAWMSHSTRHPDRTNIYHFTSAQAEFIKNAMIDLGFPADTDQTREGWWIVLTDLPNLEDQPYTPPSPSPPAVQHHHLPPPTIPDEEILSAVREVAGIVTVFSTENLEIRQPNRGEEAWAVYPWNVSGGIETAALHRLGMSRQAIATSIGVNITGHSPAGTRHDLNLYWRSIKYRLQPTTTSLTQFPHEPSTHLSDFITQMENLGYSALRDEEAHHRHFITGYFPPGDPMHMTPFSRADARWIEDKVDQQTRFTGFLYRRMDIRNVSEESEEQIHEYTRVSGYEPYVVEVNAGRGEENPVFVPSVVPEGAVAPVAAPVVASTAPSATPAAEPRRRGGRRRARPYRAEMRFSPGMGLPEFIVPTNISTLMRVMRDAGYVAVARPDNISVSYDFHTTGLISTEAIHQQDRLMTVKRATELASHLNRISGVRAWVVSGRENFATWAADLERLYHFIPHLVYIKIRGSKTANLKSRRKPLKTGGR